MRLSQKIRLYRLSGGIILFAGLAAGILFLAPVLDRAQNKNKTASDSFATVSGEKIWYQMIGRGEPLPRRPNS